MSHIDMQEERRVRTNWYVLGDPQKEKADIYMYRVEAKDKEK